MEIEENEQTEPYHCNNFETCEHTFSVGKNICYFSDCEEEIASYSEIAGFYVGNGTKIDEVIPICHFCWLKKWYSGTIPSKYGYERSFSRKDFLEELVWDKDEIECLSKYYLKFRRNGWGQSSDKQVPINDFLSRWHGIYECAKEAKWIIETLDNEKKWSDTYDAISHFRWLIRDKEREQYWKFSLIKNKQLKQLYQELEKKDIEQLWQKEVQKDIIPLWDKIVNLRKELVKSGKCNYCYDNLWVGKFNLNDKKVDYLCEDCIREEMKRYEEKEDTYSQRYKALLHWCDLLNRVNKKNN